MAFAAFELLPLMDHQLNRASLLSTYGGANNDDCNRRCLRSESRGIIPVSAWADCGTAARRVEVVRPLLQQSNPGFLFAEHLVSCPGSPGSTLGFAYDWPEQATLPYVFFVPSNVVRARPFTWFYAATAEKNRVDPASNWQKRILLRPRFTGTTAPRSGIRVSTCKRIDTV